MSYLKPKVFLVKLKTLQILKVWCVEYGLVAISELEKNRCIVLRVVGKRDWMEYSRWQDFYYIATFLIDPFNARLE